MASLTYIPIATQTLGSATASITFSSIPSTYTDLRIVMTCTTTASVGLIATVNSSSTSIYNYVYIGGNGSAVVSSNNTNRTQMQFCNFAGFTSTTIPILLTLDFMSYANTTNYKTVIGQTSTDLNGSGGSENTINLWRSTAAINSVALTAGASTFSTGTVATLWGI